MSVYIYAEFCDILSDYYLTNSTSVNITSPMYPLMYPNNLECVWKVTNVDIGYMVLNFWTVEFDKVDRLEIQIEQLVPAIVILSNTGISKLSYN